MLHPPSTEPTILTLRSRSNAPGCGAGRACRERGGSFPTHQVGGQHTTKIVPRALFPCSGPWAHSRTGDAASQERELLVPGHRGRSQALKDAARGGRAPLSHKQIQSLTPQSQELAGALWRGHMTSVCLQQTQRVLRAPLTWVFPITSQVPISLFVPCWMNVGNLPVCRGTEA